MLSSAPELACTSTELIYLAGLRGGQAIVGIEDPLRGRPAQEVDEALIAAQGQLAERRFLAIEADGTIVLDFDVARVVDVVVKPRHSIFAYLVTASATAEPESGARRVFHIRGALTVEVFDEGAVVRLVPLAGRDAIGDAVLAFWSIDGQEPAPGDTLVLPREAMRAAARTAAAQGVEVCESDLLNAGVATGSARALAETLARPRANGALLSLHPPEQRRGTVGLGMLYGDNGLWRLRPLEHEGVPSVELEPCTRQQLAEVIRRFVRVTLS